MTCDNDKQGGRVISLINVNESPKKVGWNEPRVRITVYVRAYAHMSVLTYVFMTGINTHLFLAQD